MAPNFPDSRRKLMDCPGGTNTGVTRGSLMARRISRRDCARDWIKSTLRIREKKANKTQEWSWQNFNPWRREQEQGSEATERRKRQEGRTQRDFSSVRLNTGGNTGGNITWNARNHLKLFPEALLDFIRGLCQLAELPHSALDLGSVDPGGVQGLRDTDPKQHRVSRSQPWKHNSNTNPLS